VGVIIHTGDFKIDLSPLDAQAFDLHTFAEYGKRACWRCYKDSTMWSGPLHAERRAVIPRLDEISPKPEVSSSSVASFVVDLSHPLRHGTGAKHGRRWRWWGAR